MTTKAREMEMAEGLKASTGCEQSNRARASAGSGTCRGAGAMTASCCTFEPGTGRVHRLGLATGALLLLALCSVAVPNTARAQVVLVQNFGENNGDHYDLRELLAQGFNTGSDAYRITSIQLVLAKTGGTRGMRVRLLEDGPGDEIFTFNSGTITNAFNRFSPPLGANRVLLPNTDYFIEAQQSGGSGADLTWIGTNSDDDSGTSGWSLENAGHIVKGSSWTVIDTGEPYKVRIYGERTYPATGAPTITGTRRVGQTLTAQTTGIADTDGLNDVSYTYQWIQIDGRTETDIGSDSATYTVAVADSGKEIKVRVTFSDDEGNAESRISAAVDVENTPATGAAVTGPARVGQTVTAATLGITDPDGLSSPTYSYQWFHLDGRTERNISGQTSRTYMPVAADVGRQIGVRVSFVDAAGSSEAVSSPGTLIRAMMPPATCPALSTPTGRTQIWTGTVEVAAITSGGTTTGHGYNGSTDQGSLSDPKSFDLGASYTVDNTGVVASGRYNEGSLWFSIDNKELTAAEIRSLRLHVCGETYAFAVAQYISSTHTYLWPRAGLDWSSLVGMNRGLRLTKAANVTGPKFTPSVSGRYNCFMEENPEPGDFVCRTYFPDHGNKIASIWAYSATDRDGDTLTYSLEGPDASNFNINPANGSVTTKAGVTYDFERQGSCTFEGRTHRRCMKVILKATDPEGLSTTQDAIVTLENGFEIQSLNVGTWLRDGYAVNPKVDLRWDRPWHGGGLQTRTKYEIQYYDTTSADVWSRKYNVDKNTDRTSITRFMQFGRDYMVRVVAKDEDNLNIDETPWRPFSTGNRDVLSIADAQATEGEDASLMFAVTLRHWASKRVTVGFATADGTAVTGGSRVGGTFDYAARSGTVAFEIGEKTKMITVPIYDDDVEDSPETMTVRLSDAVGADIIDGEATGTIFNTEQGVTGNGITATFQNLPAEHTGEGDTFDVQILFDAPLSGSWTHVRDAITVLNGTHTKTHRVDGRSDLWNIGVEATSDADVIVNLRASVACEETGALCTSDGRRFETAIATTIDGPDEDEEVVQITPLTATLSGMPSGHDSETPFRFQIRFSETLKSSFSYKTMRDQSVRATQGTQTYGATVARRMVQRQNDHWEITITPRGDESISIAIGPTTDCAASGAMCTNGGVPLSSALTATVKGPPRISVADATATEATGATLDFEVTLEHAAVRNVSIDYATADGSAIDGSDYTAKSGTLWIGAGEVSKTISVAVLNDGIDEGSETMTLRLSNPSTGASLSDATATGTITNTDPMPKAWLTRFGRTVASQAVDAIGSRMDGDARSHLQVGGMSLNGAGELAEEKDEVRKTGLEELAWRDRNRDAGSMTASEMLLGSAFQLSTGGENGDPAWTAWGRFSTTGFEADVNGVRMDGDVTSGFLGADISRDQWLGGLALSMSRGDGDFSLIEDDETGEVESTLTAVYPYTRFSLSERLDLWGMVGVGTGDVTLTEHADDDRPKERSIKTDISMRMGAIGARGELLSAEQPGGMSLAIKTDAFFVEMESEAVHHADENMVATKSDASRLRLALEGSRAFEVGEGILTPRGEIGIRQDGGDAETGTGVEIGGGISYQGAGFSIEGSVRKLVAHEESGYEEWGASGSVRIDPGASGRGLSLILTPTFGAASSGVEQLWSHRDATGLTPGGEFEAESRFETELGYGIGLRGNQGLLTPYTGLSLGEGGDRTWRTGTRWKIADQATLALEATRSEARNATPVTALILRSVMRW